MSADDDTNDDPGIPEENEYENVVDESGEVNKKHKEAIIDARNRVDEREDAMFTGPLIDPAIGDGITDDQRVKAMGRTVRMFIRRLRPLLVRETVEGAEQYANQVELGEMALIPPDKDGIPFSELVYDDVDERAFRQEHNLPRGADLPKPQVKEFHGLLSLLVSPDEVQYTWRVATGRGDGPETQNMITLHARKPVPMHILENAIMAADDFMQEAGIGVKLDSGPPVGYV